MKREFKSEKAFQKWVIAELEQIPKVWIFAPPTKSRRGIPDIIGICNGFFIALELKKLNAKPDPSREVLQSFILSKIENAGSPLVVSRLDPKSWPEVKRKLIWLSQLEKSFHEEVTEDFSKDKFYS